MAESAVTSGKSGPQADHNTALGLLQANHLTEAEALLLKLTQQFPHDPAVWNSLGVVLVNCGEVELAINAFDRALAGGAPVFAWGNLLYALHAAFGVDPQAAFRSIQRCGQQYAAGIVPHVHPRRPDDGRPLRIGYLWANDLSSTRQFAQAAFLNHDPAAVQVHGYLASSDAAEVERGYGQRFAALRPIAALDDETAFRVILADDLDLLIDLCGHAHRQRLRLLARRPAPVQATYLESFYSTGLPTIDYLLSDLLHSPPQTPQRFTEALVRLPRTRLCYTPPRAPDIGPLPARSRGHVTFGSFNHLAKVNRQVASAWSAVLRAVPSSRLILKWKSFADTGVRERVARRFRDLGIAADRLELRAASEHFDMLREYNDVDLALDPFPHNGGLTTCEALWMGVPVLCLRGDQIVSRQSSSIWQAVGLTDFIADDLPGYVSLAAAWARDHDRLEEVRARLRNLVAGSTLCDAVSFTRDLEGVYRFITGRRP